MKTAGILVSAAVIGTATSPAQAQIIASYNTPKIDL